MTNEVDQKAAFEPPFDCRVMPGLTQCPNPLHFHKLGPLVIGLQIAQDYWALRDRSGNRVRRWLAVETVKALDGDETILNFVVLRLSLSFGWQRGAQQVMAEPCKVMMNHNSRTMRETRKENYGK